MLAIIKLRKELKSKSNPRKAKILRGFFETGKGEYGEGDVFLGVVSAETKRIALKFKDLNFKELQELLRSKIHEERVAALRILIHQFQVVMLCYSKAPKSEIFNFYLKNTKNVNNWGLVDMSAPKIVGEYLLSTSPRESRQVLYKFAKSKNLWERRIAIISTFAFIRQNRLEDTLKISKMLLNDKQDLIHKAVGWMLREVGKRSQITLEKFLKANYKNMPRTMLRYAIERFPEKKRKGYLNG
ncbi:MAG: DNA alkylation repair protein [Spirochaetia bacterium]|nr:MAG: DNA alkylation repair protein [Spirochaetia bacterium]